MLFFQGFADTPEREFARSLRKMCGFNTAGYEDDRKVMETAYEKMGRADKAERQRNCGTFLTYRADEQSVKLYNANFCKLSLCPACAWRRFVKILFQLSCILDYMEADQAYRYIHLTLAVKNCSGEMLNETVDLLFKAFNKLIDRRSFGRAVKGFFRKVEITHSWSHNDYHPHLRVLLAVAPSYFDSRDYVDYAGWRQMWQECLEADYNPQIRVKVIENGYCTLGLPDEDKAKVKVTAPLLEAAKYVSTAKEYIAPSDMRQSQKRSNEAIRWMDGAISGRRLVAYGGEMKRVHKLLHLDDVEEKPDDGLEEIELKQ